VSAYRARADRIRATVTPLLIAVVLASCGSDLDGLPMYFDVENRTDEAISIVWHRENGEQRIVVVEVSAGKWVPLHVNEYGDPDDVCGDGELVALDPAGREVARSPMDCRPWVIDGSG
jgi:hypothetical protein